MEIDYSKIVIIAGDPQVMSHSEYRDITFVKRSECNLADEIAIGNFLNQHTPTLLIAIGLETPSRKKGGLPSNIERMCAERRITYLSE